MSDPSSPIDAPAEHVHSWQANGLVREQRQSRSPCSQWDDVLWTQVIAVQSCACGKVRRVSAGEENVHVADAVLDALGLELVDVPSRARLHGARCATLKGPWACDCDAIAGDVYRFNPPRRFSPGKETG